MVDAGVGMIGMPREHSDGKLPRLRTCEDVGAARGQLVEKRAVSRPSAQVGRLQLVGAHGKAGVCKRSAQHLCCLVPRAHARQGGCRQLHPGKDVGGHVAAEHRARIVDERAFHKGVRDRVAQKRRARECRPHIRHEEQLRTATREFCGVSEEQLGRIAGALDGNRAHVPAVEAFVCGGARDKRDAQRLEKSGPKRVALVERERLRDADKRTPFGCGARAARPRRFPCRSAALSHPCYTPCRSAVLSRTLAALRVAAGDEGVFHLHHIGRHLPRAPGRR